MISNRKKIRVLISFIGTNDLGKLNGKNDGAVLTVFKRRSFDEVHLLWNPSKKKDIDFESIANYVKKEIVDRGLCKNVVIHRFDCKNVTDHNEIYPKLLSVCRSLDNNLSKKKFTAAIASGTPAMQVCWILMAESGDFPLELIRSNEPQFGKPIVTSVRLGTGLPRIIRLEKENRKLKKEYEALIPRLILHIKSGLACVSDIQLNLSPISFCYYYYFAKRAKENLPFERFSGIHAPFHFLQEIVKFHQESFPDSDLFREKLEKMVKLQQPLDIRTFRANISKLNKQIKNTLENKTLYKFFTITTEGKRHALCYGLHLPPDKIVIKND
ncbi:MAG: RNA repair transcriptional activator RtcR family protein [Endomicrobia bacterium]|nr:RNA repair transcriptional activator RtcR family protein [Endomicrobiia bacterium]